jgi:hypothetical protein
MKKKPKKKVKVKVTEMQPAAAKPKPIWLATDLDEYVYVYGDEPVFDEPSRKWCAARGCMWATELTNFTKCFFIQLLGSLPGPGECWRIEI